MVNSPSDHPHTPQTPLGITGYSITLALPSSQSPLEHVTPTTHNKGQTLYKRSPCLQCSKRLIGGKVTCQSYNYFARKCTKCQQKGKAYKQMPNHFWEEVISLEESWGCENITQSKHKALRAHTCQYVSNVKAYLHQSHRTRPPPASLPTTIPYVASLNYLLMVFKGIQ